MTTFGNPVCLREIRGPLKFASAQSAQLSLSRRRYERVVLFDEEENTATAGVFSGE